LVGSDSSFESERIIHRRERRENAKAGGVFFTAIGVHGYFAFSSSAFSAFSAVNSILFFMRRQLHG
jgi:hypothetical protein